MLLLACLAACGCTTHYKNALCERNDYYAKWKEKCDEYSETEVSTVGKIAIVLSEIVISTPPPALGPVKPNAYGPGVGMDATGRPVTLQGGAINSQIRNENAYGPGVHMDQYGNPVQWR